MLFTGEELVGLLVLLFGGGFGEGGAVVLLGVATTLAWAVLPGEAVILVLTGVTV